MLKTKHVQLIKYHLGRVKFHMKHFHYSFEYIDRLKLSCIDINEILSMPSQTI